MLFTSILMLATAVATSPVALNKRSCPNIQVFGARETTASPGFGEAGTVVDEILNAYPGSQATAIIYPACGGGSSCGGVSYSSSVSQGDAAVVSQVSSFAEECPESDIVLVGYSQGAEIFDNTLCGGGDPNQGISSSGSIAGYNIKAVILMGDPRFQHGAPYDVGTCEAGGFDARPTGQTCGTFNGLIQSYCDASDPYCCNGSNAATHNGYGSEYGQVALNFVKSKLGSA